MESWEDLVSEINACTGARTVYVIGASDRGKTTFCRHLVRAVNQARLVAYIDCDPGQSVAGPPSTIGLELTGPAVPDGSPARMLFFTGSVSPTGHLLQNLSGVVKLAGKARALGSERIVIDSSGFILGSAAREFQFAVIDLLEPDFLVAFEQEGELEGLLGNFARRPGTAVRRPPVPPAVSPRGCSQRQEYRAARFREYFTQARAQEVDLSGKGLHGDVPGNPVPEGLEGLLVGLCDAENLLVALGVILAYDEGVLTVHAPPFDGTRVNNVQFGSVRLDLHDFATRPERMGSPFSGGMR
ncbi:MAG TPA: polynucleotide 5'-hydroxyl-kinase [Deltaproteobacteria bacterium]|jgi:polynucleotide 5'-hydroxyl-kinase GRC3/NOL9|nr:polynucleotide 5'-hydroxyl-kinase [Deltaproteobacteria bacterium]HOI07140.1 polynucleotide 5'-hydroxyl-kinase [Deltaproteobacteria bacterium]